MQTPTLLPGRYMKISKVNEYLQKYNSQALPFILRLDIHEGEHDVYYSTIDLKKILKEDFFRDMECSVVTHLILSESEKAIYNL